MGKHNNRIKRKDKKGKDKAKPKKPRTEEVDALGEKDGDSGDESAIKWTQFNEDGEQNNEPDEDYENVEEEDQEQDQGEGGEGRRGAEDVLMDTSGLVKPVQFPEISYLSQIKNKLRRRELYIKFKAEKNKEKRETRKQKMKEYQAMGDAAPPKAVPRTIENTREPDETMVDPEDEEVKEDEAVDELASYFRGEKEPKVIITSSDNPHVKTIKFCRELKQSIPNAEFRWRNRSSLKRMTKSAAERGYTDILVVNEDIRKPNGLLLMHLPNGPTSFFKLSSVRYCKDIKRRAKLSNERPEVIINNFNTRLGHTIGRMFASLYHFDPQFHGRKVVTFHNQRDYVFFRHHRYEFKNGEKVALQEIGPRFTLKLRWLQKGTFDTKCGEYEWLLKRHEMETSRRRFFL